MLPEGAWASTRWGSVIARAVAIPSPPSYVVAFATFRSSREKSFFAYDNVYVTISVTRSQRDAVQNNNSTTMDTNEVPVAEHVDRTVAGCASQRLLNMQGKPIDAGAHVHSLSGQPERLCLQLHASARNGSATQLVGNAGGSVTVQPLGLRKLIAGAALAVGRIDSWSSAGAASTAVNRRAQ